MKTWAGWRQLEEGLGCQRSGQDPWAAYYGLHWSRPAGSEPATEQQHSVRATHETDCQGPADARWDPWLHDGPRKASISFLFSHFTRVMVQLASSYLFPSESLPLVIALLEPLIIPFTLEHELSHYLAQEDNYVIRSRSYVDGVICDL